MSQYIYLEKKALKKESCKKIIDEINFLEKNKFLFKQEKNFYKKTSKNVYEQFWSKELFNCILKYKKKHKFLDNKNHARWIVNPECNYQKYKPNQFYKSEHCEQNGDELNSRRMLVWMIYCNTIKKGGETYFPQQDLSVKPEEGTVVIWPASWTHSHQGKPAPKENKYIITGWASYVDNLKKEFVK